jgi:hypothetical protein
MFARAIEIGNTVTDAYAIRAACPKALKENGYSILKELRIAREVLE